jgi:hypothetical protein
MLHAVWVAGDGLDDIIRKVLRIRACKPNPLDARNCRNPVQKLSKRAGSFKAFKAIGVDGLPEEADFLGGLDDDDDDDEEEEDENEDEEEEDDRYRCVIAFDSSYELSFQVISHTHCDDLYAPPSGPWSLLSQGRRLPRPNPANRARKGCSNA